eukprot:4898091-Prymnesium_polylepis.1
MPRPRSPPCIRAPRVSHSPFALPWLDQSIARINASCLPPHKIYSAPATIARAPIPQRESPV